VASLVLNQDETFVATRNRVFAELLDDDDVFYLSNTGSTCPRDHQSTTGRLALQMTRTSATVQNGEACARTRPCAAHARLPRMRIMSIAIPDTFWACVCEGPRETPKGRAQLRCVRV
jgi:hypothetical protein